MDKWSVKRLAPVTSEVADEVDADGTQDSRTREEETTILQVATC